jgi:hypothetical protein
MLGELCWMPCSASCADRHARRAALLDIRAGDRASYDENLAGIVTGWGKMVA